MNEEIKLDVIDPDAVIDIKMSTGFYNKVQEVLQFLTKDKTQAELNKVYAQIKEQKITDPYADVLQTLFILIKEFQVQANKAGHVSQMTREEAEELLKKRFPESEPEIKIMNDEFREEKFDDDEEEDKEEPAD